jgi:hypothetical protein
VDEEVTRRKVVKHAVRGTAIVMATLVKTVMSEKRREEGG